MFYSLTLFLAERSRAWLAADTTGAGDTLLQYGAVGLLALIALGFGYKLFQRQMAAHEAATARAVAAHERDIARADRAEQQLAELNKLIRDELVSALTRATDAIARTGDALSEQRTARRSTRGADDR